MWFPLDRSEIVLSSMPWLRLSFMLTITSRGCIFLSPLHFGVVTLPRECTSGTDDYYVRSHMYTLPDDDDAVTPADDEINVYLYLFLPLFISFRLSAYSCDSIHCNVRVPLGAPMCIHTSKLGVKSVTYRCNFRRTLLHCHGSAAFLARRFGESTAILISQFLASAHISVTTTTRLNRKHGTLETNLRKFKTQP